jgi:YhgE/Pip-like protein
MKHALLTYLKKPQSILAVIVALMAQLIFCAFWMTAYDGVLDRTGQLSIAIVNEDGEFGQRLMTQLHSSIPFQVKDLSGNEAREKLEKRKLHLIVTIPSGFGETLMTTGAPAKLSFTMNESNPQLPKGLMQTVVSKLSSELNTQLALQGTEQALKQLQIPQQQAAQTAAGLLNRVIPEINSIYPVKDMANQMVPMMLVLASYVGAMLMAMNLYQVSADIGSLLTRTQHFAARIFIIVTGSFIVSLAGSGSILLFGGQVESGFAAFWLFHWLTVMTFMFIAQMFLLIMGMPGMFINMALLSLQLVSSGTIVPKEMLSTTYQAIAQYLPASYSVEGFMNLQFGGLGTPQDVGLLIVFSAVSLAVSVIAALLRKKEAAPVTQLSSTTH